MESQLAFSLFARSQGSSSSSSEYGAGPTERDTEPAKRPATTECGAGPAKKRAATDFTTIRVCVSGEPFDIGLSELAPHPECIIPALAERAARPEPGSPPRLDFARDVRAFRIIRRFIGCGELLVPPDPIDRELLRGELDFYGLGGGLSELFSTPEALQFYGLEPRATGRFEPPRGADPAPGSPEPPGAEGNAAEKASVPKSPASGWVQPSQRDLDALSRARRGGARAGGDSQEDISPGSDASTLDDPLTSDAISDAEDDSEGDSGSESEPEDLADPGKYVWAHGTGHTGAEREEFLSEADARERRAEQRARLAFGAGKDGTEVTPVLELLGPGTPELQLPERERPADYTYFARADADLRGDGRAPLVASYGEFLENFSNLTLGLGARLFEDLPLVAAGGAVLAALHHWPGVEVPREELSARSWEGKVETKFASEYANLWPDPWGRRWRRRTRPPADEIQELRDQIEALRAGGAGSSSSGTPPAPPSMKEGDAARLGRIAQMHGGRDFEDDEGALKYVGDAPSGRTTLPRMALRGFIGSDVDLFLTTRDPGEALRALEVIYRRLRRHYGKEIGVFRSAHSVSFIGPSPHRVVQVILRLYDSCEHVILGFDLDCCSVAFDGLRVRALPRAARALAARYNLVDVTRQSSTYETRLVKYMRRGFSVGVPYGTDIASIQAKVASGIRAELLTTDMREPARGLELLIAILEVRAASIKGSPYWRAGRSSDYGACMYPRPPYRRNALWLNFKRYGGPDQALLPFMYSDNLSEALGRNVCIVQSHGGPRTFETEVPRSVTFLAASPHLQDRVDLLYTGSFHPLSTAWLPRAADRPDRASSGRPSEEKGKEPEIAERASEKKARLRKPKPKRVASGRCDF